MCVPFRTPTFYIHLLKTKIYFKKTIKHGKIAKLITLIQFHLEIVNQLKKPKLKNKLKKKIAGD